MRLTIQLPGMSPTSRSGRSSQTASPQKGDARTIAQYAEDGRSHSGNTAPDAAPRRTGQGAGAEGGVHSGVEDCYSSLPRGGGGSPHKTPASAKVGAVASEMNGKIERLYECHVRSMDVIAQQQALLSTLHRCVSSHALMVLSCLAVIVCHRKWFWTCPLCVY